MPDNSETPKAAAPRKTMAPAARRPEGEDGTTRDEYAASLERLDNRELDRLETALRAERTRRARQPVAPSFGISEGERAELEQHGETTSPWNGEKITGDGAPRTSQ